MERSFCQAGVPIHMPKMEKHQTDALEQLEDGNILWGGVGSGKSRVAIAYYKLTEEHEDLYVITTAKKRDEGSWHTEAAKFAIGRKHSMNGLIHVDSWNNIDKYKDIKNAFFIFDEQRLVGSGTWVKAFLKIAKNNRWILLSATPGDTWLDYIPVFVANGFYKNRTEFKRDHVVYNTFTKFPKVERYNGVQKLNRLRSQILVHMLYYSEAKRHSKTLWMPHDKEKLKAIIHDRWNPYQDKPIKNVADLFYNMRQVVNSDPSRVEQVLKLREQHERLIVFYNFNYELELLRGLSPGHLVAEWNGHKHEPIPDSARWIYLVQYTAGSEGWNCTDTNAMCFYSLTYSYKQWEQSHGRIDRINTPYSDLFYYNLVSKSWIDKAILEALNTKKSFNEAKAGVKIPQIAPFYAQI